MIIITDYMGRRERSLQPTLTMDGWGDWTMVAVKIRTIQGYNARAIGVPSNNNQASWRKKKQKNKHLNFKSLLLALKS